MSGDKPRKIRAGRGLRLVAIGTLSIALFTLGLILLVRLVALGVERSVKEQLALTVELSEEQTRSGAVEQLQARIRTLPGVKHLEYITAEQAVKTLAEELGENPVEVLGYNPLSPILRISLEGQYMQADSLARLSEELANLGLSTQFTYREDLLDSLEHNMHYVELVLWVLLALEVLLAYVQISNTTRLWIYAQRLKIRTLSLVGASSWFIRRPFVMRGLVDALIAWLVALCLLGGLLYAVALTLGVEVLSLLPLEHLALSVGVLLVVAVSACMLTASRATHRYIRMDAGKIYLA